jgi:magnesium-transporting ATPase (P-type)
MAESLGTRLLGERPQQALPLITNDRGLLAAPVSSISLAGSIAEASPARCQQIPFLATTSDEQKQFALAYARNTICTSKYTVVTWLPKSVFEQFRRLANVYFLASAVLMLIGTYATYIFESPLTPWSTLGPLALVMGVTSVKEAFEDWQRHKSDRTVNTSKARVLKPEGETIVLWENIVVGDLVLVKNHEPFPADLVVVGTSADDGICYIETSNIDGETNLKIRERVTGVDTRESRGLSGTVEWEAPNKSIYTFAGSITASTGSLQNKSVTRATGNNNHNNNNNTTTTAAGGSNTVLPLDAKNLLLRGSVLRNTPWVHGLVVYTGVETKIMMNSRPTPSKLSKIEHTVNRLLWMLLLCQVNSLHLLPSTHYTLTIHPVYTTYAAAVPGKLSTFAT